ncbi:MAG TPA: hypothetical protein VNU45_01885 [Rummeliibacillus sp.]|nr:hypothetical protein [Rummeliibacillus sp.]
MKKTNKFILVIGTTLLIGIGVFTFYQKSNVKAETDKYVPISHSDENFLNYH